MKNMEKSRLQRRFCIVCLVVIALLVPAAVKAKKTTQDAGKKDVMPFESEKPPGFLWYGANVADMRTFDPHFATRSQFLAVAEMMFNRLVRYGANGLPEPELAENIPEPEIIEGKQVWTFTLKKGVMFHLGPDTPEYEMTADDVVFSLDKTIHLVNPAFAGDYSGMDVEKKDDHTIRIIMEKPVTPALFMPKLAAYPGGFIISEQAFRTMGYDRFKKHPIGTGPFKFESRTPGEKATLTAHESYYRGKPQIAGVEIFFISDSKQRELGFATGKLDIIDGGYEKGWLAKWEKKKNTVVDLSGIGEIAMIHFNTRTKPFNDIRVRKAIAFALDRDMFAKTFDEGITDNVCSPTPVRYLAGGMKRERVDFLGLAYERDFGKARNLLAEAGYADGFQIKLVSSEMPVYRNYYESIREQLARINVECEIDIVRHPVMHMRIRKDANPMVLYIAWRPDTDANLTRFFHSDSIMITGARPDANFSYYEEVDKLIETARYEIDPEMQMKLWKYTQIKVLDDMAVYPVHFIRPICVRRPYVDFGRKMIEGAVYPPVSEKTRLAN